MCHFWMNVPFLDEFAVPIVDECAIFEFLDKVPFLDNCAIFE